MEKNADVPKERGAGQKCRCTNQHTPLSPLKRGVEENADAPKERGLEGYCMKGGGIGVYLYNFRAYREVVFKEEWFLYTGKIKNYVKLNLEQ